MADDYDYHLSMNDETELDDGVHAVLLDTGSCATPRSWAVFCRRRAGRLWPLYWLSPYVHRGASLILEHAPLRPRHATP
ncbi:MAG: hypothetical protein QOF00_1558 [Pseudonocardiales bacterium]|jgi:hypothetical protein|nr:hypothetical protein [Pseudonocardiales bacterium]